MCTLEYVELKFVVVVFRCFLLPRAIVQQSHERPVLVSSRLDTACARKTMGPPSAQQALRRGVRKPGVESDPKSPCLFVN